MLWPSTYVVPNNKRPRVYVCAAKTGVDAGSAVVGSWSPFFTVNLVGALCGPGSVPPLVFAVFTWLGYVNSTMNPVIYSIFNREFRDAFRRVLATARRRISPCCYCCSCSSCCCCCGDRDGAAAGGGTKYGAVRTRASAASTAHGGEVLATLEDPLATRTRSSLNAAGLPRQISTRI